MRCAFCARPLFRAAVMVGTLPVGPQCARRAGLLEPARKGRGLLRLAGHAIGRAAQRDARTLDLFEGVAHG